MGHHAPPFAYHLHGDDFPQRTFPRGIIADQDSAFSSRTPAIVVYLLEVTRRIVEGHRDRRDVEVRPAFLVDWGRLVSPKCKDIASHRKDRIRRSCRFTTNRTLGQAVETDLWDMSRVHMSEYSHARTQ